MHLLTNRDKAIVIVHIAAYASYSEAASPDRELREGGSGDGVGMIDYEAARRREQR